MARHSAVQNATSTASSSQSTRHVKQEKVSVKTEGRNTRSRKEREQREENDDNEGDDSEEDDDDDDEGTPKGSKRRRINGTGDSVPSRTASQDIDDEHPLPKAEKRYKTQPRDVDGYIPGSIVRIQLQNFVTYDYVEFRPGPYLNMILGPNGTGKSSIACAICLGLNWPPSVLGRASELKSFVKLGADSGYIEIELKGPKGKPNLVIRRNLNADADSSTFTLNGKATTGTEIKRKMAELNVQVGNLCTFLPQDKVSSFAGMGPQELLRETQRAAGDERLSQWQQNLISDGKELQQMHLIQKEDENQRKQLQGRNEAIENHVKRFKERQNIEFQVNVLNAVIPVEIYRLRRLEFLEAKGLQREAHQKVMTLKERNAPAHDFLARLKERAKTLEREREEFTTKQRKRFKKCHDIYGELEGLDNEVDDMNLKIDSLKKEEAQRHTRIKNIESEVESMERELQKPVAQMEDMEALGEEQKQANLVKNAVDQRMNEVEQRFRAHADRRAQVKVRLEGIEREVKRFEDADAIKLQHMQRWHQDTHDAILWLRQNKHLFKKEVFEPPYVCMTVPDKRFVDAVESYLSSAQMRTFVAQCKDDVDLLNQHINDTPGLGRRAKIVTWYRDYTENQLAPPPMSQEELNYFGFDGYAIDYVECPEGLKWFLKRECNLHRNAIALNGSNVDVGHAMEAVARPETGGGASFINGNVMNIVQRSRYGSRAVNNMTRDVPKARNFTVQTIDPDVRKETEARLAACQQELVMFDEERKELDKELAEIKADDDKVRKLTDSIRKRKEVIRNEEKKRVALESKLKRATEALKNLRNAPSVEQERKKLHQKLLKLNMRRAEKLAELMTQYRAAIPDQQEATRIALELLQTNANIEALEVLCKQKDAKYNAALERYQQLNERYVRLKTESKQRLEEANAALAGVPKDVYDESARINQGRKDYFEQLDAYEKARANGEDAERPEIPEGDIDVRTLAELEETVEELKAKLEMNGATNAEVVKQYEDRKRNIEQIEKTIEQRKKQIEKIERRIKTTRDQWEPALRSLIEQIREKFSGAFDRIGCAGDVELVPDEEDYEKWRVDIRVKFRDHEKLQLLTGQRQSGGERSLTTILYLMSLTALSHTPFSLVDEINQGMDRRAERTVHNSMVEVTCREESGQYFLITPKLLPDLMYHPRMKILCVNNGEWLPESRAGNGMSGNMMKMIQNYVRCRDGGVKS